MASQESLQADLSELQLLRAQSKRAGVQAVLDTEIKNVQFKLEKVRDLQLASKPASTTTTVIQSSRPVKKLTTFAYDESDKFVKLYYTLSGIQNVVAENVKAEFGEDSFVVRVSDLNNVDVEISAKGFTHPIDPSKSCVKQKSDSLLVMLKKAKEGQTWQNLLKLEKAAKVDVPKFEEGADPQASIMSMMKKMYDDGDDEMKRTIKKAMFESQNKRGGAGDLPM